ncbi:MAG: phosphoadenosine phosphosulfate reductase family protein [Clostridium sp.]|uniref:phosphoadenosine phosphosulfate reductase family protein n=1 Tax=Clostridium sp. TaxID=1506 RepID=UPI003EE562FE
MNLVYKEYIGFLKDKGLNIDLKEGYYWLDRQIIKAYDKQGDIHKVVRIYTDDNLEVTFKYYPLKDFEIEPWKDTVERNKNRLLQIEKESLDLIKASLEKYKGREIACLTSGGKDSSVTSYLIKHVYPEAQMIFNNTTLDCADTYLHIKKENNLTIINPKEGFYQWRERNNFVINRTSRSCCQIFKENSMVDYLPKESKYVFFMGMRNEESNTRSSYGDEWKNLKWGTREWNGVLPIRKWSEVDVWLYILFRGIPLNLKYKRGYSRVGCAVACPFYTKSTWILDRYWYPKMYERWHKILEKDFIDNKKAPILNCTLKEYHLNWNGTGVRDEATEEVIQEFATMYGLNIELARKYFNKRCTCCGKKLKKNDVALSLKYYGRHIQEFKCMKCISVDFGVKQKDLKERIKQFKSGGCDLF